MLLDSLLCPHSQFRSATYLWSCVHCYYNLSLSSCLSPHWMLDSCSILIDPLPLTISITLYISPLSIVSAIEQLLYPALPRKLVLFAFALLHVSAIPHKVVLAYPGSLYTIVVNGSVSFMRDIRAVPASVDTKKWFYYPVHRSSPVLLHLSTCPTPG